MSGLAAKPLDFFDRKSGREWLQHTGGTQEYDCKISITPSDEENWPTFDEVTKQVAIFLQFMVQPIVI